MTVLNLFASLLGSNLLANSGSKVEIISIKPVLPLEMQSFNYVLSMPVNVIATDQMSWDIPQSSQAKVIQKAMKQVIFPAGIIILNLTNSCFSELKTD